MTVQLFLKELIFLCFEKKKNINKKLQKYLKTKIALQKKFIKKIEKSIKLIYKYFEKVYTKY